MPHPKYLLPVKKLVSKWIEFAKGLIRINNQCISRNDALYVPIHDSSEAICCGFRPHSTSREVLLEQISEVTGKRS